MRSLCVFCGTSTGARPDYASAATAMGRTIAQRGLQLTYGGASIGLMGLVADGALAAGGEVIGVLPATLRAREGAHQGLTRLEVVESMHERKARMADLSDGFIALPGGAGTLEEIFEAWTWGQLRLHHKPVGFLDVAGYFGHLSSFLDHAVAQGFVKGADRRILTIHNEPAALVDQMCAYAAPDAPARPASQERASL